MHLCQTLRRVYGAAANYNTRVPNPDRAQSGLISATFFHRGTTPGTQESCSTNPERPEGSRAWPIIFAFLPDHGDPLLTAFCGPNLQIVTNLRILFQDYHEILDPQAMPPAEVGVPIASPSAHPAASFLSLASVPSLPSLHRSRQPIRGSNG